MKLPGILKLQSFLFVFPQFAIVGLLQWVYDVYIMYVLKNFVLHKAFPHFLVTVVVI